MFFGLIVMQSVSPPSPLLNSDHELLKALSPALSFHLRKLLRQNYDRLRGEPEIAPGEAIEGASEMDSAQRLPAQSPLAAQVLASRKPQQDLLSESSIQELETLVARHESLGHQGMKYRQELRKIEQEIFERLGFVLPDLESKQTILIIDDTPENLRVLSSALIQQGYEVRNAINGPLALSRAQAIKPDLILLDVMMPGMDGYEVCGRLKENPQTRDIPVIFVSAVDQEVNKVKAFGVGGVDYITKPFQIEEVLARIGHQLNIWNLQRRLEDQNMRLQQEIQDRKIMDERYRSLFENTIDGIFQTALDGHLIVANPALANILGYENAQTLIAELDNVSHLYAEPRRRNEFMQQMKQWGEVTNFESQVKRRDGSLIWVSETARVVRDPSGAWLYYEGSVRDITEIKASMLDRDKRKQYIRQLLLSLFPKSVAKLVLRQGDTKLTQVGEGVVLWVDWHALTQMWMTNYPVDLIPGIRDLVGRCDHLAESYGIEYTRLMSNTYVAIAGFPMDQVDPASRIANFALAIQQLVQQLPAGLNNPELMRMGIEQGKLLAGVIGERRLSYEVWGEAIEGAERLCAIGLPGKIQVSDRVAQAIRLTHRCEEVRRTGASLELHSRSIYWLEGRKN